MSNTFDFSSFLSSTIKKAQDFTTEGQKIGSKIKDEYFSIEKCKKYKNKK